MATDSRTRNRPGDFSSTAASPLYASARRPRRPARTSLLLALVSLVLSAPAGVAVAADRPAGPTPGPATVAPDESARLAASGHRFLAAALDLPGARAAAPGRAYEVPDVSQEEAELLFANAEAAVYFPETGTVRLLSRSAPSSWVQPALARHDSLGAAAMVADPLPLDELAGRARGGDEQSLLSFAAGLDAELLGSAGRVPPAQYLVKLPSLDRTALPPARTQLTARAAPTANIIYESFDGDVFAAWSRYDSTGGLYSWGQSSCEARSGPYSVDAVRGGSQGPLLSCEADYPPSVFMFMLTAICDSSQADQAWLDFYLHAAMAQGQVEKLGVFIDGEEGFGWGYSFWGNWNAAGSWFRLIFNLKQWDTWGDLTQYPCNNLSLRFQSDAADQVGFGARVDDQTATFGSGVPAPGQCTVLASPLDGTAPLTVAFQGLGDTYASYSWDFKDGSTSTERNPTHVFTVPGNYWVDYRGSSSSGACTATARVTVTQAVCTYSISPTSAAMPAAGGAGTVTVTASGPTCGWQAASNASWITVTAGASGSGNGTVSYQVAANPGTQRAGTVTIAGKTLTVTQAAAACVPPEITTQPANATIATGQSVTLSVATSGSAPLGYQWYAGEPVSSTPVPGATASSYTTPPLTTGQSYFVVVTNACGTAQSNVATVTVQAAPYSKTYYLSGIARTPGVPPSFWYSDLAVLNPSSTTIGIRVRFFGNDVPAPLVTTVSPLQQRSWKDVLSTAFGLTANQSGVIVVEATGPAAVTARTYSRVTDPCTAKVRTDGQSYPGLEGPGAVAYGQVAFLPNLRSDDPYATGSGFRTNVEAVNVSTAPIDVEWTFYTDTRANLGTVTRTGIQPNRRVGVTAALPGGQIAAFAEARVLTPGGQAIIFASVVDATSTDPTTVEAALP